LSAQQSRRLLLLLSAAASGPVALQGSANGLAATTSTLAGTTKQFNGVANGQASAIGTLPTGAFPLAIHSTGRYLKDANNNPWRIQADAAWLISSVATAAQIDTYVADRKAKGFNSFYFMAMVHPGGYGDAPNAPNSTLGYAPFATPGDFSTVLGNQSSIDYWNWIDLIIDKAAAQNMAVMFAYNYLGYGGGNQGWAVEVAAMTSQAATNWGTWLGNRFKSKSNIVWFHLGDYTPVSGSILEQRIVSIINAIRAAGATQVAMAEPSGNAGIPTLESPAIAAADALMMNSYYGYSVSGNYTVYYEADIAYQIVPLRPVWPQETGYEFENNTGQFPSNTSYGTRRTRLWALTSGALAGDGFGSHDVWAWNNFPGCLTSAGQTYSQLAFSFIATLQWWDLLPSGTGTGYANKTLIASGQGTWGDVDYITSAVVSNGSLLLAFIPGTNNGTAARTFSVDMTAMNGLTRSRWWNPVTGSFVADSGGYNISNTGTHSFTTPGSNGDGNDWLLVLDTSTGVALSSTVTGLATAGPATLDRKIILVGQANGLSTGASTLNYTVALIGQANGQASVGPNILSFSINLIGTSNGAATAGTAQIAFSLSTAANGLATAGPATLDRKNVLVGTSDGRATAGSAQITFVVSAQANGQATAGPSTLSYPVALTGQANGLSSGVATPSGQVTLIGHADGIASNSVTLTLQLNAQANGIASGQVTLSIGLTASANGQAGTSAVLARTVTLAGSAAGLASGIAVTTGNVSLNAQADGIASGNVTGLTLRFALSGQANGYANTSVYMGSNVSINGQANAQASATALATVTRYIIGTSDGRANTSLAVPNFIYRLVSTITGQAGGTGNLGIVVAPFGSVFPYFIGMDVAIKRKVNYDVKIITSTTGKEQRLIHTSTPRYTYSLRMNMLNSSDTSLILNWIQNRLARLSTFTYWDPVDGAQRNCRLDIDEFTFEQIVNGVWKIDTLNFITVK
jgi:hypothetical protein